MNFQLVDIRFMDAPCAASDHAPRDGSLLGLDFCAEDSLVASGERCLVTYLFGRGARGESVCVHVYGYQPHLYYRIPEGCVAEQFARRVAVALRDHLRTCDMSTSVCSLYNIHDVRLDAHGKRVPTAYVCVRFASMWSYSRACYVDEKTPVEIRQPHHTKPSVETKFLVEYGLVPSRWVCVDGRRSLDGARVSHCDIELVVDKPKQQLTFVSDIENNAPLRVLAFDIEAVSESQTFPLAHNADDVTCQVSIEAWTMGAEQRETHLISLGPTASIDGCTVHSCETEAELYARFRAILVRLDPDFVLQYNGYNFDIPYMYTRANETLNPPCDVFNYTGRFRFVPCKMRKKELKSKGMGANALQYIDMHGRCNFDVFLWYKNSYKEASYSLNDVARRVLGDEKEHFSYKDILPHYHGTPEQRAVMGRYCVKDSVLLRRLAEKLTFLEGDLAQSAVSMVLVQRLQTHGQGNKVISQMASAATRVEGLPFILDNGDERQGGTDKYDGATVIEPQKGYHDKRPVIVLDFASLYPSVMMAHNLCKSTCIRREEDKHKPGVNAFEVGNGRKTYFSATNSGILPTMLSELLALRKSVKKRMALVEAALDGDELTPAQRSEQQKLLLVLNKRQLAVKISANSVYGFMGAEAYPCREAAETTTAIGRRMLMETAECIERESCKLSRKDGEPVGSFTLVYGDTDSLMFTLDNVYTPADGADAGEFFANMITNMFAARGETSKKLEYEKCYFPFMLFSKKKYGGILWNRHRDGHVVSRGQAFSGTPNKRRDSCSYVQKMYEDMLGALLANDRERAMLLFRERMRKLLNDDVAYDDMVLSKAVGDEYKTPGLRWQLATEEDECATRVKQVETLLAGKLRASRMIQGDAQAAAVHELTRAELAAAKAKEPFDVTTRSYALVDGRKYVPREEVLAHMRVVDKQRERDPGSETRAGDRVQFVYCRQAGGSSSKMKARDVVEDLEYARSRSLPLDIGYYIEHQVKGPIQPLLELIHPHADTLFDAYAKEYEQMHSNIVRFGTVSDRSIDASSREAANRKRPRPTKEASRAAPLTQWFVKK